jgi:ubiquinone/menaquinone biosynthesis C-methylase UbiE
MLGEFARAPREHVRTDAQPTDAELWDQYWSRKDRKTVKFYDAIATFYRTQVIRRNLEHWLFRTYPAGARLLHAGCGSGGVDSGLHNRMIVTAVDISSAAITVYGANNPGAAAVRQADIFALPFEAGSFDGAYNLGVLEHFTIEEIERILAELNRVIRPGG